MTKKQKKMLSRILISAVLFLLLYTVPAQGVVRLLLYLIPYAVIGWDVLWRAVKNIRNGQVFDENFLMSIATIGAFGCGEYPEAVAVMLFYQVGELFQSVAVGRSRQSIAALMDIRPIWNGTASWSRWTRMRWRWETPSSSRPASGSPWMA